MIPLTPISQWVMSQVALDFRKLVQHHCRYRPSIFPAPSMFLVPAQIFIYLHCTTRIKLFLPGKALSPERLSGQLVVWGDGSVS